eukprot:GHVR01067483.1.p1 GENE.GHVR01067483.1~~GHVR01067483.1.p1  ORF type:complete len:182 (+),score=26.46 GHVR01067483.1:64-609(+)
MDMDMHVDMVTKAMVGAAGYGMSSVGYVAKPYGQVNANGLKGYGSPAYGYGFEARGNGFAGLVIAPAWYEAFRDKMTTTNELTGYGRMSSAGYVATPYGPTGMMRTAKPYGQVNANGLKGYGSPAYGGYGSPAYGGYARGFDGAGGYGSLGDFLPTLTEFPSEINNRFSVFDRLEDVVMIL